MTSRKNVFINEDLSQMRFKILFTVKKSEEVEAAWTIDGKIHCLMKEVGADGRKKKVVLDTVDDMFNLCWIEKKLKSMYSKV